LKTLNLAENPISSSLPGYRLLVIKALPSLEKLDDVEVSYQERDAAENLDESDIIN